MVKTTQQKSFLERLFPTFVGIFRQIKSHVRHGEKSTTVEAIAKRPQSPFFIQGITSETAIELSSREQLLDSLGWVPLSVSNYLHSPTVSSIEPEPKATLITEKKEIAIATAVVERESESPNFFIHGLQKIDGIETVKNMDLLAVLGWTEQGQILLDVDPDDYELLDNLLDME